MYVKCEKNGGPIVKTTLVGIDVTENAVSCSRRRMQTLYVTGRCHGNRRHGDMKIITRTLRQGVVSDICEKVRECD